MLILIFSIGAILLAGVLFQLAGQAIDKRRFPPVGRLVDIGGHLLHLVEKGKTGPTVILESGISATCLNWAAIQEQVADFARVYSYDRAPLGWSDPTVKPRTLLNLVDELRALLTDIPQPYILVGHSFGGMLVRAYAVKYPAEVAGLVLVDPLSQNEWINPTPTQQRMLGHGVKLARRGALLVNLGVVRFATAFLISGARRIPKLVARLSSGRAESVISRLTGEIGKMPPETWPMIRAHWCQPKSFSGLAMHLESLPASSAQAAQLGDPPPVPITILSAANSPPAQLAERDAMTKRSPQSRHIVVQNSGHWIHLDQPGLVIEAIRQISSLSALGTCASN